MFGVVYGIFVKGSNKPFYIGQSTVFKRRKREHFKNMEDGHKHPIYCKMRNHECEIIPVAYCNSMEELNATETIMIEKHRTFIDWREGGYNLDLGGGNSIPSLETRRKMSEWQIGRKMSEESKAKMSKAKKGKPPNLTDESRQKVRKSLSSPESKAKRSEAMRRRWNDLEARDKLLANRPSQKGKGFSEETRLKMSEAAKKRVRKPHSEETKRKMSESAKRWRSTQTS